MTDIVERLDKRANMVTPWATCCGEARDEIKRLRAALNELWQELSYMDGEKTHRLCGIAKAALAAKDKP